MRGETVGREQVFAGRRNERGMERDTVLEGEGVFWHCGTGMAERNRAMLGKNTRIRRKRVERNGYNVNGQRKKGKEVKEIRSTEKKNEC